MEINHDITLEEIYIPSKHAKDDYLCEDFIIYPDGKEKTGGYVLGILEIRAAPIAESEKIIKVIVNTLKEKYYGQINSSPDPQKLNLEMVFEYALQKTNEALSEMIEIGRVSFTLENLHYIIAVAKPNPQTKDVDFLFTQQGLVGAFLLHKTKQNNYKVLNIIENASRPSGDTTNRVKFFSSTLSGKVYYHDAIFICSEIFNNYIPPHKVNKILSNNDLPTAIDYFKSIINNVRNDSYLTYSAVFIKMEEKKAQADKPISQRSIDQLLSTKEKTEKYLTPTFTLNIGNYITKAIHLLRRQGSHDKLLGPVNEKKHHFAALKYILGTLGAIFNLISRMLKKLWRLITRQDKISLRNALRAPKVGLMRSREKISSLPWFNKSILIIVLILVVIFVSSVFWIKYRQTVKEQDAIYTEQINKIKSSLSEAQVNLIYGDEGKSLGLTKTAEEAIAYLPQATNNQKANFNELMGQLNTLRGKLLHIEKVVPRVIAEIIQNNQPIPLIGINKLGDDIFAYGRGNTLFRFSSTANGLIKNITFSNGDIVGSSLEDENLLFVTNQNKLLKYDKDDAFSSISINWDETSLLLNELKLYNNNIYVLSPSQAQIFRYRANDKSFSARQAWIKDRKDADLSQAISLAIDGNIYVITKAGTVYKFYAGNRIDFSPSPIEPALKNVTKIYTSLGFANLYIAEDKRIVVMSTSGKFVKQYLFETLDAPITDLLMNEKDKKIIISSGNKVYEAGLN